MPKIKRGCIAFLLSILLPGLGHVYDGQPLAAWLIALAFFSFISLAALLGLFRAFGTAAASAAVSLTFQLAVAGHAALVAVRQVRNNNAPDRTKRSYRWGVLLLGTAVLIGLTFPGRVFGVRGYKVSAISMKPTLIVGDRFAVDVKYYATHRPSRGDVVVFRAPANNMALVKRIIAVGGDAIQGDSQGTTVNGRLLSEPYVYHGEQSRDDPRFGPVDIPPDKLFVMGDNRGESYDSRHFGLVDANSLIGRALYIYYSSSDKNRIGRTIQ